MLNTAQPSGRWLPGGLPLPPSRPILAQASTMPAPRAADQSSIVAQLPKAPPLGKRATVWDRDHASETLANIAAGFFGSQNFGEGLGAAASTIATRTKQLRDEEKPDLKYGGPGDQFEISTDRRTGERTIREVPDFREATDRAALAKLRPNPKDLADLRGRALYAIATQVPPEQRAAAYRRLMDNPSQFGVDTTGMPAEWDETYGALAGSMGMNVAQTRNQDRGDRVADANIDHTKKVEAQGDERLRQGAARVSQGAARVAQGAQRLRAAPPSVRRGYSTPQTRAQFDALPRGAKFMAPDGSLRIKP